MTHFLCLPPPPSRIRHHTDYAPFQATIHSHLLSLTFSSTQHCYRAVMQPSQNPQALPSFNIALHPDSYKTTLPNISYPSRPSRHVPWSGSSAPLVFSVGQTFFSIFFCQSLILFSPPRKPRPQSWQLRQTFKLVILFPRSKSYTEVDPPSFSGSHSQYMFWYLFQCFPSGRHVDWGEVDWCFVTHSSFNSLISSSITCQLSFKSSNLSSKSCLTYRAAYPSLVLIWISCFACSISNYSYNSWCKLYIAFSFKLKIWMI